MAANERKTEDFIYVRHAKKHDQRVRDKEIK